MNKYINQIIHDDCLNVMKDIPDKSIDLVLTDPPWNVGYFEDDNKDWIEYRKWLNKYKIEMERIANNIIIFLSTKSLSYIADLFENWMVFASIKNFSQMTKKNLPYCWDIAFIKNSNKYNGKGRNWFLCNTAGMMNERVSHPTQRTQDVIRYLINILSKENDLIFDGFAGSGTTALACIELNRRFICVEKDLDYYEIAKKRIEEAKSQLTLF